MEGCGDSGVADWRIVFGDFVDEGKGVKSSLEEELNNSMKTKNARAFKHWRKMWLTLVSCFTILTTELVILNIKMVFESCESNYPP